MIIQEPVKAAIWHCLNHYDYKNAVFLSERLCSEVETDETIYLLATSYFRSNLIHQAFWLLKEKSRRSPQCRFLQAKCAYHLKKFSEAECVLTNSNFGELKSFDEIVKDFGETACFVLELIAKICLKTERNKIAGDALKKSLKLNPFLWQAFADLCHLGEHVDAASIFQIANMDTFNTCQGNITTNSLVIFPNTNSNNNTNTNTNTNANTNSNANTNANNSNTNATNYGNNENQLHSNSWSNVNNVSSVNNNSNIFSTPIDQQMQTHNHQNLITPNNNNNNNNNHNNNNNNNHNLNSSITILRGNTTGAGSHTHNNIITGVMLLEDTPISGGYNKHNDQSQNNISHGFENNIITPHRRQFKYLSTMSPTTPSFGVLPINSPLCGNGGESPHSNNSLLNAGHTNVSGHMNLTANNNTTPSPQTLSEVNQEQKVISKKVRNHVGNLISRKEPTSGLTTRPAVFTQTGNITPRTPNNNTNTSAIVTTNAAVRRSSRLFGHNSYSVKENNKSPTIGNNRFLQPRSPPRKTKSRMSAKICLNNELIEDNNKGSNNHLDKLSEKSSKKEKIETITTSSGHGNHNSRITSSEDTKVLYNNSLNNAQTMAHHVYILKKQSAEGLMALLRDMGEGYRRLAHYDCKVAIKHFESTMPKHHLCSSWVQCIIARAHYELREYESAVSLFKRVHELDPYRMDSMEIYSSALWHLQKEVELSTLAQDLVNQDKLSPITWCVSGNCFSLHKEHETAIKFFKRAVQVDSDFVYSYTLLGHELVLTEELDKALDHFRAAVLRDPRHYNAWFGIGTIFSKQEKYELAELHYMKALKINPQNSVVMVHIGAMQYFMNKKEKALQTLHRAAFMDPKNPLARFHRGSIYYSLGRHQEALRELEELKEIVPKESVVFYLIGKIHKTLGNVDLALMHFSWATDLDPKGANNQIKDAFDSMTHPSCCSGVHDPLLESDVEPVSDRSDDSTQAQQDLSYDSDAY